MCALVLGMLDIMTGIQILWSHCELPAMGAGEPNLGPQQEQQMLTTAEPSLQPPQVLLCRSLVHSLSFCIICINKYQLNQGSSGLVPSGRPGWLTLGTSWGQAEVWSHSVLGPEGSECLDWYRSFLGIGLIKHFCKQISRSLMWPQSTMFSALALQADGLFGTQAEHFPLFPVGGSTLEQWAPVRGHSVFASATVSRFVLTAQLLRVPKRIFYSSCCAGRAGTSELGEEYAMCLKKNNLDARKIT